MIFLEDPLDSDDFDCVQYINQRFPTESSLDDLDSFINEIGAQIGTLDEEISKAVQTQSVIGKQASTDIAETQESIEDLFGKIHDIKLKASQSERMVQEICADIKKLDYAKTHLQTSITSLNRLQMLINAVGQLELLVNEHHYREVANLLDAVKQFMTHFDQYAHIPLISDLIKRINTIREELTSQIRHLFKKLAEAADTVADIEIIIEDLPGGLKALSESCLVVDALGTKVRRQLLEEFVQMQLVPYESLFGVGKQHFQIEQVERRWSWFKRLLKYIDAKFGSIFPSHWRLPLRLCLEFTERTKIHLVLLLTEMENSENSDVHALLKALQSALRFEQEMSERFNLLYELKQSQATEAAAARAKEVEAEMQKRLKRDDKLMYIPTDHNAINKEDETESGFLSLAHSAIAGGISGVFDKFLGSYVLLERQNLEDLLQRLSQEEDTTSEGVGMGGASKRASNYGNVYGSSTSMFVFIKNSIKRCTALTTGQTFLSLSMEFKACMIQYVDQLTQRCLSIAAPGQSVAGIPNISVYKLPPGSEVSICYLINTAEYCAEVVPQLEQMVQQKMAPNLASKVDFMEEVDAFMDFAAFCLKVLVSGLMDRMDGAFKVMQGMNWGSATQVGEESSYLHTLNKEILEAAPKIKQSLSSTYFNNFCNKFAAEMLQRYLDIIVKQKRITDIATQQLLLDTYNVKAMLLQLPSVDKDSKGTKKPAGSSLFTKLVNSKVSHIEVVLKLVGTPEEMLLERFRIMWPDGQPSDLQMLMSLKGTKRTDQQVILEMLGLSAASKIINKTANSIFTAGEGNAAGGPGAGGNNAHSLGSSAHASYSSASAAAASAAALASSHVKNLTMDFSSSARSAVGNLKSKFGQM